MRSGRHESNSMIMKERAGETRQNQKALKLFSDWNKLKMHEVTKAFLQLRKIAPLAKRVTITLAGQPIYQTWVLNKATLLLEAGNYVFDEVRCNHSSGRLFSLFFILTLEISLKELILLFLHHRNLKKIILHLIIS